MSALRLVVLCAGASRRLGQPKALAALGPAPGDRALLRLLAAGAALGDRQPLVVTGAEHERLLACLPANVEWVHNPEWRAGRTGSVRCAVARRAEADLCLAPVDVPRVSGATFAALAAAWARAGEPPGGWLAPCVPGPTGRRHGHPVVIGRRLLEDLQDLPPDRALHALRQRAAPLLELEVDDPTILEDLDTPLDLSRLRAAGIPPGTDSRPDEDP